MPVFNLSASFMARAFLTTLIVASLALTAAYPIPNRDAGPLLLAVFAIAVAVMPFFFQPMLLVAVVMIAVDATPAAWLLKSLPHASGFTGEQVGTLLAMLAVALCTPKAFPVWASDGFVNKAFGPRTFWLWPLIAVMLAWVVYQAGANGYSCLFTAAAAQGYQLGYGALLDCRIARPTAPELSNDAPMGA